jgi:cytochrome c biogenesis protein CcdA
MEKEIGIIIVFIGIIIMVIGIVGLVIPYQPIHLIIGGFLMSFVGYFLYTRYYFYLAAKLKSIKWKG